MRLMPACILVLMLATNLSAEELSYGGSGCPQGSASVEYDQEKNPLKISFSSYTVDANTKRQGCALSLPVKAKVGKQFRVSLINFTGSNKLFDKSDSAKFSIELFFAGSKDIEQTKTTVGPVDDAYNFQFSSNKWSLCGVEVLLRANTSLVLQNTDVNAISSVKNAGSGVGLFQLEWRSC